MKTVPDLPPAKPVLPVALPVGSPDQKGLEPPPAPPGVNEPVGTTLNSPPVKEAQIELPRPPMTGSPPQ
jgi:hypothetical protein